MPEKPIQTSGALFEAVQRARLFRDSKAFPDSLPRSDPEEIMQLFTRLLDEFVAEHFEVPESVGADVAPSASIEQHIDRLWETLTRQPDRDSAPLSTQIAVSHPYVVPGGRFRESYYWDTYFTAEGLVASGRADLLLSMVKNFAELIDRYGHIPNGNRVYYLSRSQPPLFCCMLQLLERADGPGAAAPFIPQLEAEYRYWMDGADRPAASYPAAYRHVVALSRDVTLNRYWDDRNTPREESHGEDVALFDRTPQHLQADLYRNIRAAAESGWDFSSRWLTPDPSGRWQLESIRTTEIIPVDLNCALYNIEAQLAEWVAPTDPLRSAAYAAAAIQRRDALLRYCWSDADGWFFDYCWTDRAQTQVWSLAAAFPLFLRLADAPQAARVAEHLRERLLRPGGLVTTDIATGQQWDAPNGWAPLQWVAIQGLMHYQHAELAREIAARFVGTARSVYQATGKLMEKYDVCDLDRPGGGGEYPLQDGFGWTNGVVRALIAQLSL